MIASPAPTSQAFPVENEPVTPKSNVLTQFSGERASEMAKRSWVRRKEAKLSPLTAALPTDPPLDDYSARRLMRVRKQLDAIDDEIDRTIKESPDTVKPLVESSSRLSEQERFLANRPGPGTRKPQAERKSRGPSLTVCAEDVD